MHRLHDIDLMGLEMDGASLSSYSSIYQIPHQCRFINTTVSPKIAYDKARVMRSGFSGGTVQFQYPDCRSSLL